MTAATPIHFKGPEATLTFTPAVLAAGSAAHAFTYFGVVQHMRIDVTDVQISVVNGATSVGGTAIGRLPDKNCVILNAECNFVLTKSGDFVAGDDIQFSVGSVTAASEALNGADANIIAAQDKNDGAVAGFDVEASRITSNTGSTVGHIIDSATNDIYLNAACDDDGLAAAGILTVNGTLDIWLVECGNVNS